MNLKNNQNVKDIILPLKVAWIALAISIVTQNIVFIYQFNEKLSFEFQTPFTYIFIFLAACLISIALLKSKFTVLIKSTDTKKAPMTKKLPESEQNYLRFYPKYFLIHIILWLINDFCTIVALAVSIFSKNYSYLLITSVFTLSFNLILLRPDYNRFYELRNGFK